MQYSLKTLFVLFVVLGSSFGAFGPWGILVTTICAGMGVLYLNSLRSCLTVAAILAIGIPLIVNLLTPAVSAIREPARRAACANNMKQLSVALYNYHKAYGSFPPAVMDGKDGRPMHSWRTLILPYVGEPSIYQHYKFDEPWDGPRNQNLAPQTVNPYVYPYRCRSTDWKNPTQTNYFAVVGPHTAWPEGRGSRLDEFKDGLPNTILLVEMADMDVHWMEPRDVTLDDALGPPDGETRVPQSRHHSEGAYFTRSMAVAGNILFADGSVRTVHKRLSRDDLAALVTIDGGENVDLDTLLEPTLAERLRWERVVGLPLFILGTIWFWLCLRSDARAARESGKNNRRETETQRDE